MAIEATGDTSGSGDDGDHRCCSDEDEEKACAGECVASSPAWFGWLLLGFLAGVALATTVLFVKHDEYPETRAVPT
jgi:hypothetical protein